MIEKNQINQDQDFEKRVFGQLETKTQVSRTTVHNYDVITSFNYFINIETDFTSPRFYVDPADGDLFPRTISFRSRRLQQ